jgi:hypothetical protein
MFMTTQYNKTQICKSESQICGYWVRCVRFEVYRVVVLRIVNRFLKP